MNWNEASVIPAKAGIHPLPPWMPAGAGMTNKGRGRVPLGRDAISYFVDERKLTVTSW